MLQHLIAVVPDQLESNPSNGNVLLGLILVFCFILIALSQWINFGVLGRLGSFLFTPGSIDDLQKTEIRAFSLESVVLLLNFILVLSVNINLTLQYFTGVHSALYLLVGVGFCAFLFLLQLGFSAISGWITGEFSFFSMVIRQSYFEYIWLGLPLFLLACVWVLNPQLSYLFYPILIVLVLTAQIFRVIRGSLVVFFRGAPLYYIILYLCTLEILPLFAAYYYVSENFMI